MAGIYIHIPFCKQACIYCNFHFKAGNHSTQKMTAAICNELLLRKHYLENEQIDTIYFGGGTPSLLTPTEIATILNTITTTYPVSPSPEITLEANPDDLNENKISSLYKIGINRLSIGVQSFDDKALQWMNRAHTATEAVQCIKTAQQVGFDNISLDIITGIPVTDPRQHLQDIEVALSLNPQHLSCYSLTLEPNTSWERLIRLKHFPRPIEEEQANSFQETIKQIKSNDWLHYEISNFALSEKWISKHNSAYWNHLKYLGVGPSAHSFNGRARRWNLNSHSKYIQSLNADKEPPHESELITPTMAFNEAILTGIRTSNGIDVKFLMSLLPSETEQLLKKIAKIPLKNQLCLRNYRITCNEDALLFSDAIAVSLLAD
ncbi:MAG: radical SAM family heme chaperone HemW [Bacteroidia bacterium]|nr:radical SAM family heme chaperone HemW [Bacteroidia bacterium]